jgi:hypothetical protein
MRSPSSTCRSLRQADVLPQARGRETRRTIAKAPHHLTSGFDQWPLINVIMGRAHGEGNGLWARERERERERESGFGRDHACLWMVRMAWSEPQCFFISQESSNGRSLSYVFFSPRILSLSDEPSPRIRSLSYAFARYTIIYVYVYNIVLMTFFTNAGITLWTTSCRWEFPLLRRLGFPRRRRSRALPPPISRLGSRAADQAIHADRF